MASDAYQTQYNLYSDGYNKPRILQHNNSDTREPETREAKEITLRSRRRESETGKLKVN